MINISVRDPGLLPVIYYLIYDVYQNDRDYWAGNYYQPVVRPQIGCLEYIVEPWYVDYPHLKQYGNKYCQVQEFIAPDILPEYTLIIKPEIESMKELGYNQGSKYHGLEYMRIILKQAGCCKVNK